MVAGFFAFAKPGPDRPLASWFIAAVPHNALLSKWTAKAVAYWHGRQRSHDYFWVHHQFDKLCLEDDEARFAWARVPKISADGPHTIKRIGMAEPLQNVRAQIDWTTPVFKLSYRIAPAMMRDPQCLLRYVLDRHGGSRAFPRHQAAPMPRATACIASLKVSTENIGDHIQIIGGKTLLGRLGLTITGPVIDRDHEIASAPMLDEVGGNVGVLLNGWFKTNPAEWPPHPKLRPIYLGFHVRLFQAPTLTSAEAISHYRQYAPVGCRDRYTLSLLQSLGVEAFLSHCLSLTFARRFANPKQHTDVFVVSRDDRILSILPECIGPTRFISHYTGSGDFEANMRQATELLALYKSRAKLIITTMLHCALPAIAMGIPVVVFFPFNAEDKHRSDRQRFSSLEEMIRIFHVEDVADVDWSGTLAEVGGIKLSLLDRLRQQVLLWGPIPNLPLGPIAPGRELPAPGVSLPEITITTSKVSDGIKPLGGPMI